MKTAQDPINEYLAALRKNLAQGDATEHTHRAALQRMVEAIAPGVATINEAKKIECGAPDLTLRKGKIPLGHIETKDIGTPLDEVERGKGPHGKQFKRYQAGLPNWILTDYLRFDWFVGGAFRKGATLATLDPGGKLKVNPGGALEVEHLLLAMMEPDVATVETAKELAKRMAGITHILREVIDSSNKAGSHAVVAWLGQWLTSFRETLIPELKEGEFADMFAQTLAYGLFAARIQTSKTGASFSRAEALLAVPKSNPFLRKIFSELAGADMPKDFDWAVDDLVRLLESADIGGILADFGHETGQNDPIVHFYETFLAVYDPALREKRGVYYTPEPVVKYIVRSVDILLKTHFGKPRGLADEKTLILDPATGTATFLYFVIQQIRDSMKGQEGTWPGYVRDHLLKRIFGFELLMAPYAVAHLKLGLELEEMKYKFADDERLGIYLTNTLEEAAKKSELIVAKAISDEANAAADIKREKPILVVLGNPPYAGQSANRSTSPRHLKPGDTYSEWAGGPKRNQMYRVQKKAKTKKTIQVKTFIGELIDDYKWLDDLPLGEKNPKWLQNDYVKFIRFAQWRIEKTGHGIVAFITAHSYLDNPTFRGMRQSLLNTFSSIHVFDLHGQTDYTRRDGAAVDENVFDIEQGVSIIFAVLASPAVGGAKLFHSEIKGTLDAKTAYLDDHSIQSTEWTQLSPTSPDYLFVPRSAAMELEYDSLESVKSIFPVHSIGIVTARDSLSIHFTADELLKAINKFRNTPIEDAREEFRLGEDVRDWSVERAQKDLAAVSGDGDIEAVRILYRPFDVRYTVYTGHSRGFHCYPRHDVMQHMLGGTNVGLVTARSNRSPHQDQFLCSSLITEAKTGESTIQSYLFPLFLMKNSEKGHTSGLFQDEAHRPVNLSAEFLHKISMQLGVALEESGLPCGISAEDIFRYIYAIFHSNGYRTRYADFLKRDFPRVPVTSHLDLFKDLATKGRQLVALHLLNSDDAPQLNTFVTGFPIAGTDEVTRVRYVPEKERVEINDDQYFSAVPPDIWQFSIGGYQVCEKWLKDRKGRVLNNDDIQHWQRVVVALGETRRLMDEIDALIPEWPMQ
jgi:predicted helicase